MGCSGLTFAAHSGSIANGFQFIQQSWANNTDFPIVKEPTVLGFDAINIIRQNGVDGVRVRSMTDVHPNNTNTSFPLPSDCVVRKGGEYFFPPSIATFRSTFALA